MLDNGAALLAVTSTVALFVLALILAAHTVNRNIKIAFTTVLLSLVFWQTSIFIADNVTTHLTLWNHLVFFWPTLATLGFYLFITLLQSSHEAWRRISRNKVTNVLVVSATLVQLVAILSGHLFDSVTYDPVTQDYAFNRGFFYPVYLLGIAVLLVVVLGRLFVSLRLSKRISQERRAFKTIFITVTTAIIYGLSTNVILPNLLDSQTYIRLGLITVDIFAVGFALSIVRYQFLDIRGYVFRTLVYLIVLLLVALGYVGAAGLISSYLLEINLDFRAIAILSIVTLLAAISFQPALNRFNHITNKFFFRDYYDSQEVLDKLGDTLVRTVDVTTIQQESQALLEAALKPTFISYLLIAEKSKRDSGLLKLLLESGLKAAAPYELQGEQFAHLKRELKREEVALAVRLRTKHEDLGFILLGFRRSGAGYSITDKRFLGLIADQLAIGLQNALRFHEIQAFNETLQQKIEEATKKLRNTNEKLRRLDETKDDFISMASHQLRTPLTSVKGYVSMVLEGDAGKINSLQRKLLNQSFISAQRMVYLISDLLNVSRLRTGKFVIEPVPSNLAKVVKDEVDQLQETAKGRDLTLTYEKPEHFPTLPLDETKMRQVIMNFIDNAIYYTPSGGRITVHLEDRPKTVEFTVTDNGIGVPKHEQHHLFSKFFRAHNAKRARPDGTGLGLFMAKKVIVAQGGAVIFRSQEGKGSTFGFTFSKDKLNTNVAAAQPKMTDAIKTNKST